MRLKQEILLVAGMILCVGVVRASIVQSDNNSTAHDTFAGDITGGDLINSGESTFLSASGTPAFSASGALSIAGLNDGVSGPGGTDGTGKTFYNTPQLPATITFTLDTSVNTLGYDIDMINSYAGWGGSDATQVNQAYEVLVSTVGSAGFTTVANLNYSPFIGGGAASTFVSLTDSTGTIAAGVDEVRFVFANNPMGAGTLYQEIDVFGTAAIPEPSSIAMIGLVSGGAVFIRKRFLI